MTLYYQNNGTTLFQGDCRKVMADLPTQHFQCCVTSPPYFGLRSYLPAGHPDKHLELGSETTPEEFVAAMLSVFGGRDNPVGVWRVLRDDGCVFVNLGDSYAGYHGNRRVPDDEAPSNKPGYIENMRQSQVVGAFKQKDLMGIPWRLALALQAAGWYWRDTICWHKPSPMPGSQRDRCTSSWEPVLMMTKRARYFWDMEAAKEGTAPQVVKVPDGWDGGDGAHGTIHRNGRSKGRPNAATVSTRIPRNVWRLDWDADDIVALLNYMNAGSGDGNIWKISSEGFGKAHFATFPKALPAKCITAATSEKGCCPTCGKCWVRITDSERVATRPGSTNKYEMEGSHRRNDLGREKRVCTNTTTLGWQTGCECGSESVPCRVLDCFGGVGSTALAAVGLQRECTLIELSEKYCEMTVARLRAGLYATSTKRDDVPGQMTMFDEPE